MWNTMKMWAASALLAIGLQAGSVHAALLVNGGFETGNFTGWSIDTMANWALVMDANVVEGAFAAELGTLGAPGVLAQSFATTAGQTYLVDFWVANDFPDASNLFEITWNDVVQVLSPAMNPAMASAYTLYQFLVTADSSSSTLAFTFMNENSVYHLDEVQVSPVPEPGALLLFGSGIIGLSAFARRRPACALSAASE